MIRYTRSIISLIMLLSLPFLFTWLPIPLQGKVFIFIFFLFNLVFQLYAAWSLGKAHPRKLRK